MNRKNLGQWLANSPPGVLDCFTACLPEMKTRHKMKDVTLFASDSQSSSEFVMTREKAIEELKGEQSNSDTEAAHGNADDVLCNLLIELGYGDVVDEYIKVPKWFS